LKRWFEAQTTPALQFDGLSFELYLEPKQGLHRLDVVGGDQIKDDGFLEQDRFLT
jgi:hypothetical protein